MLVWFEKYPLKKFKTGFLKRRSVFFETFRILNGTVPLLERHLNRLAHSYSLFDGPKLPKDLLRDQISSFLSKNKPKNARGRLNASANTFWLEIFPFLPLKGPMTVKSFSYTRKNAEQKRRGFFYDAFTPLKKQMNTTELLLVDENGFMTEGTTTNVFFRFGEGWVTPNAGLNGIMRQKVKEILEKQGASVSGGAISEVKARQADEIWLSNALRGILRVDFWDKEPISPPKPDSVHEKLYLNVKKALFSKKC